jgi:hypothetical protein
MFLFGHNEPSPINSNHYDTLKVPVVPAVSSIAGNQSASNCGYKVIGAWSQWSSLAGTSQYFREGTLLTKYLLVVQRCSAVAGSSGSKRRVFFRAATEPALAQYVFA